MNKSELLKTAKGILFSTPMVQAILKDRKKMTRRVIKPQYALHSDGTQTPLEEFIKDTNITPFAPYQIGDILYVKETYREHKGKIVYKADKWDNEYTDFIKWKPSIFMPKSAARIFLKITNVRVERLKKITVEDIIAEGIIPIFGIETRFEAWIKLWDSLNAKRGYGWGINPFVWVYEFERVEVEE